MKVEVESGNWTELRPSKVRVSVQVWPTSVFVRELTMTERSFSLHEGFRDVQALVYDDAPYTVRYGIREVLAALGYRTPTVQRRIICSALRTPPDSLNWSDYPNVDVSISRVIRPGIYTDIRPPWGVVIR